MADTFNIDPAELDRVLSDLEQELAPVLKSEAKRLAKAKDEGSADEGGSDEGSGPPAEGSSEGGESAPPAEGSAPPAEGSAPPAEGSAPPAGPPEGSAPPPAGPEASAGGGFPQDPAAIAQMVQGLPPEILKTLYLAAKQALFAQMSAGAPGGAPGAEGSAPPAGAPPAAGPGPEASAGGPPVPPAGPEASALPPGAPAMKKEFAASPGNGGKSAPVKKSETDPEVALLKAELADLKKANAANMDLITRGLQRLAGTPVRKAVTGVSHIAKSEQEAKRLSKSEVSAKLKEKARTNLSKKDREAINRFYDAGANDITIVAHLLTE